jgi:hypothetical protein
MVRFDLPEMFFHMMCGFRLRNLLEAYLYAISLRQGLRVFIKALPHNEAKVGTCG